MCTVRWPRARRSLFVALAAAVTAPVLSVPAVAVAEAPRPTTTDTVVGEFVQAWPEYRDHDEAADHGDEGPLSFVRTASGDSVRVVTSDVDDVPLGATVEVTVGRTITDEAALEGGYEKARDVLDTEILAPPPVAPAPTSPAVTPVNHPVDVVMVVPAGGTRDSTTLAQVVNAVNNPVADFWSEQTDGAVNFGVGRTLDWINLSVGCADPYALWNAAARAVGFTRGANKHLLVYVSSSPRSLQGCSDGLGEVTWDQSTGGMSYVRFASPSIIAHEFGHNLSLAHSSLRQCDAAVNIGRCTLTPYLDLYDVMGASWGQLGSLNVVQANRLSPVMAHRITMGASPETTHTITLGAVSQREMRGIRLQDLNEDVYWLEYRPPSGRDAWLGTADNPYGLESGVLLRQQVDGHEGSPSQLLDATPSPEAEWDGDLATALPLNTPVRLEGWRDSGIFEITVTGTTADDATVRVVPKSAVTLAYEASGGASGPMGATIRGPGCGAINAVQACDGVYANGEIIYTPTVPGGAHLVYGPIHAAWRALPEPYFTFGFPTTHTTCGLADGGCRQRFVGGSFYWTSTTGAVGVSRVFRDVYESIGQESGIIGYPTGGHVCTSGDVCRQPFQGGFLVTSPATGTRLVSGDFATAWAAQGHQTGWLGAATGGMVCGRVRGGCAQSFQGGALYSSPGTGVHGVAGGIRGYWAARGAEAALGYPTGPMTCSGVGCAQAFEIGEVVWSPATGTYLVRGGIHQAWVAAGRGAGWLGAPAAEMVCGLVRGGCVQAFQHGALYWSPDTGAHGVTGGIRGYWAARGAEMGLGYPTGPMTCTAGGCGQAFEIGEVVWSPATGTNLVRGGIHQAWVAAGREVGGLGAAAAEMVCGLVRSGCMQSFQHGALYWSPATGAHGVAGGIRGYWTLRGAERGLGYPTGPMTCSGGGCGQAFEIGEVVWSPATGTYLVRGGIHQAWVAAGREAGWLGAPTAEMVCGLVRGGCVQSFQHGALYWSPATGAHGVAGGIRGYWAARGAEAGLGYPTGPMTCSDGGCGQTFEIGRVVWSAGTGTHLVRGGIFETWVANGAGAGSLRHPVTEMACGLVRSGCAQHFEGGSVFWSPTTLGFAVSGAIRDHWNAQSAERGPLGYPTSVSRTVPDGVAQDFQGGTLTHDSGTGQVTRS